MEKKQHMEILINHLDKKMNRKRKRYHFDCNDDSNKNL